MNSEHVASALDMGFDYETIRNILHLKIVQSGSVMYCSFDYETIRNILHLKIVQSGSVMYCSFVTQAEVKNLSVNDFFQNNCKLKQV